MRKMIIWGVLAALLLVWGCKEEDDDQVPQVYLTEFEEWLPEQPYTPEEIHAFFKANGLGDLVAYSKYDIRLFKLVYKTTFENRPIQVSALLAAPVALEKKDRFPILSYQHRLITQNEEAPSVNPDGKINRLLSFIASTGMVVFMPDYIGYGESANLLHPFLHKEYSVNTVVNGIQAAKEFIANVDPCEINDKLFLAGYSEGGSISLATLYALENSLSGLNLVVKATACGAGFYDLIAFRNWMVNLLMYYQPFYIAFMLESFKTYAGLNIDYALIYNEQIARVVPGMFDTDSDEASLNAQLGTLHIGELYNDDFENNDLFATDPRYNNLKLLMEQNSVSAWNLNSDVTFYRGKKDNWVPSELTMKIYSEFRKAGATERVKLESMDDVDHSAAIYPMLSKAVQRFRQY